MKKITKLLLVLLTLSVLVGALALIVSADTGSPDTKTFESTKPFVVPGTTGEDSLGGYDTFEAAAAQADGKTIYLNQDGDKVWIVDASFSEALGSDATSLATLTKPNKDNSQKGIEKIAESSNGFVHGRDNVTACAVGIAIPAGNLTVDLNGRTVRQNFEGVLFRMYGKTLTITGSGKFENVNTLVSVEAYSTFVIDTKGEIVIDNAEGRYSIFRMQNKASTIKITGAVTINPREEATTVFEAATISGEDTSLQHKIIFDSAKLTVNAPKLAAENAVREVNEMVRFSAGSDVQVINGSQLEMTFGRMFVAESSAGYLELKSYLGNDMKPLADAQSVPSFGYAKRTEAQKMYLTVENSSIVINDTVYKEAMNGFTYGSILVDISSSPLFASFDNSYLQSGGASFYGLYGAYARANNGGAGYKAAYHQITVTDCDLKRNTATDYSNAGLTQWGLNLKWIGGTIDLGNKSKIGQECIGYNEVTDGFVGVVLEDVKITTTASAIAKSPLYDLTTELESTYTGAYYSYGLSNSVDNLHENVAVITEGVGLYEDSLVTYKAIITSGNITFAPTYNTIHLATGDGTTDYVHKADGTTEGEWSWNGAHGKPNYANGLQVSEHIDAWGNDCLKYEFTSSYTNAKSETGATFNYIFDTMGTNRSYNLGNSRYIVTGIDVATGTDSWLVPGATVTLNNYVRFYRPKTLSSAGNYGNSNQYANGSNDIPTPATITISNDGSLSLKAGIGTSKDTEIDLPANGEWSRFTFVFEITQGKKANIKLPIYDASGNITTVTTGEGEGQVKTQVFEEVECVELSCVIYTYLNGELIGKSEDIVAAGNYGYGVDSSKGTRSNKDSAGTAVVTNIGTYFPVAQGNCIFVDHIRFQKVGKTGTAVNSGTLNGENVLFDNMHYTAYLTKDLAENETLGLKDSYGNVSGNILSNPYLNPLAYNSNSTIEKNLKPAIGKVDGVEYNSETLLQTAIKEGSFVEIFKNLENPLSVKTDITLVHGGNDVKFVSETHKSELYDALGVYKLSVASDSEVKTVTFKKSETESTVVKVPTGTVLVALDPIQDKTVSDWYKEVKYWNEETIASINANPELTTYTVEAKDVVQVPWVNVKSNLTLYSFYQMNIYIPVPDTESKVTDVVLSTNPEKTQVIKIFETGKTLDNKPTNKHIITLGLSDTAITTFYVSYKLDGVPMQYSFSYSVPHYAYSIMKSETQSEEAKTLIMDMVNYNSLLAVKLGGDTMSEGAKIYQALLANSTYKSYITAAEYTDAVFTSGDIYNTEVAGLSNGAKVSVTGVEGNVSVIDSYSILYTKYGPHFVFKLNSSVANQYKVAVSCSWIRSASEIADEIYDNDIGLKAKAMSVPVTLSVIAKGANLTDVSTVNTYAGNGTNTISYDYYWHYYNSTYMGYLHDDETITDPSNWAVSNRLVFFAGTQSLKVGYQTQASIDDKTETTIAGNYQFSLAGYINQLISERAEDIAENNGAKTEYYNSEIELAKALYAFAKSAKAFAK